MKKAILIISLLLSSGLFARAQLYVGGGLGLGKGPENQLSLYIAPEVGYYLSDNFNVGGKLSYRTGYNQFGVDPYLRWNFFKKTFPVRLLATLHAPLKFSSDYFSYGFYLQPGLSVTLGNSARLELHIGALGWGSVTTGGYTYSSWAAKFNNDTVSLGVVFSI